MGDRQLLEQAKQIDRLLPRLMRRLSTLRPKDPTTQLPLAQLRVCAILSDGAFTISALAQELHTSVSAATQLANRLEAVRLIERVAGRRDRRVKELRLTDRGRRLMRSRRARRIRRATEMLAQVSPATREALLRALHELLRDSDASPRGDDLIVAAASPALQ